MKSLIGIDEAGRGPLAGPVAVGAVMVPKDFDWRLLPGVNDSKKLTEAKREELFLKAKKLERDGFIMCTVSLVNARVIDQKGITRAVALGLERALRRLSPEPANTLVKLDGLLRAPDAFLYQETITKGDQKERVIGLASILAKVTRDRYMVRKSREATFALYDFHVHKGYGTKKHRELIALFGLSPLHRASYCKNIEVL